MLREFLFISLLHTGLLLLDPQPISSRSFQEISTMLGKSGIVSSSKWLALYAAMQVCPANPMAYISAGHCHQSTLLYTSRPFMILTVFSHSVH